MKCIYFETSVETFMEMVRVLLQEEWHETAFTVAEAILDAGANVNHTAKQVGIICLSL